ncbi:MAG TPA: alpha/beta hydrolase [Candidatus Paceibacterota bacterium]|nr:alpha/beta hydrolase [Candidatus Paceibacterota bacterium]
MKNAIILHGMPEKKSFYNSDRNSQIFSHWLPWLHQQLMVRDILTQIPSMPKPFAPVFSDWLDTISQFRINSDTILVGHSCGAGFWVRFLSENNIRVSKLILVAPWIDPKKEIGDFFDFQINLEGKVDKIYILHSQDDFDEIQTSFDILKSKIPNAETVIFKDKGHFTHGDMGTNEFPELLQIVLK